MLHNFSCTFIQKLTLDTFRGSILWDALADEIKTCDNVAAFKKNIIAWKGETVAVNYLVKMLF